MNQWVNIPISNIDQYTDTYSFPPLVQGHHRTFGGRADTPCEAGGQCWYQSGPPVSHAGFPRKVTTKLHRGTRASYSTAFPWWNIYFHQSKDTICTQLFSRSHLAIFVDFYLFCKKRHSLQRIAPLTIFCCCYTLQFSISEEYVHVDSVTIYPPKHKTESSWSTAGALTTTKFGDS